MEQTELSCKLALSAFLSDVILPEKSVFSQTFRSGQILSDIPRGIPSIGLITAGRVEVYSVALDGKDILLNELSVGECFGICNLLARFELETVLRCAIETEVLYIPKSVLQEVMSCNGAFALRFAAVCSEKIQFLLKRIELLTMQSCRGLVIAFLLAGQNENREVIFRGSREDLARHLGISRAALFRELAALQSAGAVEACGNRFYVTNLRRLEEMLYYPSNTK